jgi:hypothetical protein
MNTITVDKKKFRAAVEANKAEHEKLFHEASVAFYKRLHEKLEEWEQKLGRREMNFHDLVLSINHIQLDHPRGHCDEYQQALDMLEWEQGDSVSLEPHEFKQLVKDEWGWKGQFAASFTSNTGRQIA